MRKEDSLEMGVLSAQSFILDLVGVEFAWGQRRRNLVLEKGGFSSSYWRLLVVRNYLGSSR